MRALLEGVAMKIIVFGEGRPGVLEGDEVLDISASAHGEAGFVFLACAYRSWRSGLASSAVHG